MYCPIVSSFYIWKNYTVEHIFSAQSTIAGSIVCYICVCICDIYVWYLTTNCDIFSILFISLSTSTFLKKAHMIHKHESYSSFLKSITNLCNIYQNYSFYPVCFSICLLYHIVFIKIKIWNQCMPNESWLRKDCGVINGFSKKHMYDLDWKFSILKKILSSFLLC